MLPSFGNGEPALAEASQTVFLEQLQPGWAFWDTGVTPREQEGANLEKDLQRVPKVGAGAPGLLQLL